MSWVRYDDGFDCNPKVTAVIAEDPGAIALHTLANTWSARTKRPGFVPTHQPGVLVGKAKGMKWSALLEKHGLFDPVDGGWEFHDHADYRESAKRSTAGTPADVSAKRREAGRKGGKTTQQRKQTSKQVAQQTKQDASAPGAANHTPAVSPAVPTELRSSGTPDPVPTSSGALALAPHQDLDANAGNAVGAYVRGATEAGRPMPTQQLRGKVGRDAKRILTQEKTPPELVVECAYRMGANGYDSLDRELQRVVPVGNHQSPVARAEQKTADRLALVRRLESQERGA